MLIFERLEGPFGIPVFYQQLPHMIKSSAIALTVFTGAADDLSVGEAGLYHWLEHVPFRGTEKFPGGASAVKGPITRVGGNVGAWTNDFCTNYRATLPTRHLELGMDVVVDLVARPLLNEDAIIAERDIIYQEILDRLGSANGNLGYRLYSILWNGHPLGESVLGSQESLASMNPETVREARRVGYDRSRMAFFVSTALGKDEILDMVSSRFGILPSQGVSERRMGASFGPLSWENGKRTEIETEFSSAVVKVLFWLPPSTNDRVVIKHVLLRKLFSHGGPGSPLHRALRENNHLTYGSSVNHYRTRDGGFWGFHANTSTENVGHVERALAEMFHDPQLRSRERFEGIKEAERCGLEMEVINPDGFVNQAVREVALWGMPVLDEEMIQIAEAIPHEEILEMLDEVRPEDGRIIIASRK